MGQEEQDEARSFQVAAEKVKDYAIFLLDSTGVIRTWNPAAVAMKGYSTQEAIGAFFGMLYRLEDQREGRPEHNLQVARERGTFQEESWRRKKDGSLFWALVEIIAVTNAKGELTGFCKITRDLSPHKALNEELAKERERAQVTLAAISDAVVSFDNRGKIDYLNPKAEELTGWQVAEASGRRVSEVVQLRDADQRQMTAEAASAIMRPGPPSAALLVSKDGTHHEVEQAVANIQLLNAEQAGGVIVLRDIGHVRSAEKELKHADRRKDEFLAMLAHELRNPLAPISAASDLLAMDKLDRNGIQRASGVISRQVAHMTSLINDLLDVSRVTRGLVALQKAELDCKAVIADAIEQVRPLIESRSHHLTVDLAPGAATVEGDQKRLVQVITNLLANAAKYTPPGGHIVLGMDVRDREVLISVTDDGIGMSPELVQRSFEMFTQAERSPDRAQGGLGLGLALVRSLVELHGGSVTAESAGSGCGSKFTVVLPRVARSLSTPSAGQTPRDSAAQADARLRVLVVDDNVDAAQLLAELLIALGHEVAVEHQSHAALALADRFGPHVCLLDIGLPDLDGLELGRRLRQRLPHALLVAVTGYGQPQDFGNTHAAGYDYHLVKPVNKHQLIGVLGAAVERGNNVTRPP